MKTISILQIILLALFFSGAETFGQESKDKRPNIIFILADDLGAGDLHCTGHPYAKTPNLDRLAEKGIRFERAYMAGAWCAPSRYGIMSGQFPARYFDKTLNIRADEPCVTQILKDAGYKIAHIGKWHLSQRKNNSLIPEDLGIDMHFLTSGMEGSNTWTKKERNDEYWRAGLTDAYVDMAIDFIKKNESEESSKPFYMNLWIYPTHSYIHPSPEQLDVYKGLKVNTKDFSPYQQEFLQFVAKHGDIDKTMQAYCADVTAMDKALGRLFDFLKESGMNENTMVVFTSDNGPGPLTPQVKSESVVKRYKEKPDLLNSVGSAKIYKERKVSLHDGGIRVPFIVSWPKSTPKGKVDNTSVIHGTDWLPTVASICNAELPNGIYDGTDVKAAFFGKDFHRQKDIYWTQAGAIAILQNNWKGILEKNGNFKLYDIVKDPTEQNNLKTNHPKVAEKLQHNIRKWSEGL